MDVPFQYVNIYVPESLLRFGPFSERREIYGYKHTISLERGAKNEVQHTLVVSQAQSSLAHGPMPCGAPLVLLGEISNCSSIGDEYKNISRSECSPHVKCSFSARKSCDIKTCSKIESENEDSKVSVTPHLLRKSLLPDAVQFGKYELPNFVERENAPPHTSEFWLLFGTKPYLHLTRVRAGRQDLSLKSVNIIFYSADEIRSAQLLCNKYICDSNINSSLSFFICKVKHEPREKEPNSYVEFLRLCVLSAVYLMKALMFLPRHCVKLQYIFSKLFDFQSATLTQLSVRMTQLDEMQRICEMNEPTRQGSFVSSSCSCRFSCLKEEKGHMISKETEKHSSRNKICEKCAGKAQVMMKLCNLCSENDTLHNSGCDLKEVDLDAYKTNPEKFPHVDPSCPSTSFSCASMQACGNLLSTHSDTLVLIRLLCVVVLDVLLGLLLLSWMTSVGSADVIYDIFLFMAESVSSGVLQLLSWLRGAPAGLKLNQPLTLALATFFSYHVGLWTLYLEVAGSAVYSLCCALVYCGVLGATVQFALLSDLLHFATLHLQCFYVYAARLHMVQVSLLGSQWRAFRGNKWNPLKLRVDSLHSRPSPVHHPARGNGPSARGNTTSARGNTTSARYPDITKPPSLDENNSATRSSEGSRVPLSRVLSAIIFTLVVFLLPTTTVYYVVFLSLRLLLLFARELLRLIPWLIHHNPAFAPCVLLCHPLALAGEVEFQAVPGGAMSGSGPVALRVGARTSALTAVVGRFAASPSLPALALPSLAFIASSVLWANDLL